MISYAVYKVIHYLGIFALVATLSAALGRAALMGSRAVSTSSDDPWRRRLAALHGAALFVILLGGFGMLARLDVDHGELFPTWVWAKLAIWVVLAALVAFRRSARWSARALVLAPLLAFAAAYVAFMKPF